MELAAFHRKTPSFTVLCDPPIMAFIRIGFERPLRINDREVLVMQILDHTRACGCVEKVGTMRDWDSARPAIGYVERGMATALRLEEAFESLMLHAFLHRTMLLKSQLASLKAIDRYS